MMQETDINNFCMKKFKENMVVHNFPKTSTKLQNTLFKYPEKNQY